MNLCYFLGSWKRDPNCIDNRPYSPSASYLLHEMGLTCINFVCVGWERYKINHFRTNPETQNINKMEGGRWEVWQVPCMWMHLGGFSTNLHWTNTRSKASGYFFRYWRVASVGGSGLCFTNFHWIFLSELCQSRWMHSINFRI